MTKSILDILLVDDEPKILKEYRPKIEALGYRCHVTDKYDMVQEISRINNIDIAIIDYKMSGTTGITTGKNIHKFDKDIILIMLTAYGDIQGAVNALQEGFFDYIQKPAGLNTLKETLSKAAMLRATILEVRKFREQMEQSHAIKVNLLGNSESMLNVRTFAHKAAEGNVKVLITGDTGTGKGVLAKYIHQASARADNPFLSINCGSYTDELLANELFGHAKGAFTGAGESKKGLFELTNKGTLFLDEVADCSPRLQSMLLHVLQDQEYMRVGGEEKVPCDVRVISATNEDIVKLVQEKVFREDLYYRLNVIEIYMPKLSERKDDIPILVQHFLKKSIAEQNKYITSISNEAINILMSAPWPGNVRELENVVTRVVALCDSQQIQSSDIPTYLHGHSYHVGAQASDKFLKNNSYVSLNTEVEKRLDIILALHHLMAICDIGNGSDDKLKLCIANAKLQELNVCNEAKEFTKNTDIVFNAVVRCKHSRRVVNEAVDILMGNLEGALKMWWKNNAVQVAGVVSKMEPKYSVIVSSLKKMSDSLNKELSGKS